MDWGRGSYGSGSDFSQETPSFHLKIIGEDIKNVEFSWPVGMPLVRSLGRDFWEVRSRLTDGKMSRIIFCVDKGRMVLLHGFIKKSRKTPKKDIDLAVRRKRGEGL